MIQEAIREIIELERNAAKHDLTEVVFHQTPQGVVALTHQVNATVNGRTLGEFIPPVRPKTVEVSTLTGLLDAVTAGVAGDQAGKKILFHVVDHHTVKVQSAQSDIYGGFDTFIQAKYQPQDAFQFDNYYSDPSRFIIALQVAFHITEPLLYLIKLASNLKTGNTVHAEDDGFSQSITLKAGEVSTQEIKVSPRIKLIPMRSFSEPAPVVSEFLIRFKADSDKLPSIALFNVDGTRWKVDIMQSIKTYLAAKLPEGTAILA